MTCAIAYALCALATSCDPESIDPTAQFFAIGFRDDLSQRAKLSSCSDDDCHELRDTWELNPGETAKDIISDRGVYTTWLVDVHGRQSCLALEFDITYEDVVVNISQATPLPCADKPLGPDDVEHGDRLGHE